MSDQKSPIAEPQKSPGAHKEPQRPIAPEHKPPMPGQAKPAGDPPKPAWQPTAPKK